MTDVEASTGIGLLSHESIETNITEARMPCKPGIMVFQEMQ